MPAERCLFWRNLGPELNHIGTPTKEGKRLLASPYRASKNTRKHDALEALAANVLNNMKQAIAKENFGRLLNKKASVQLAHWARLLPSSNRQLRASKINERLQSRACPTTREGERTPPLSPTFSGHGK